MRRKTPKKLPPAKPVAQPAKGGIKVERGIALPAIKKPSVWPFDTMAIGESFQIPDGKRVACEAAMHRYRVQAGWHFAIRAYGAGFRCWRIK